MDRLRVEVDRVLSGRAKKGRVPEMWDAKAGERIADHTLSPSQHKLKVAA
jgi:hypothetical protein